jgi:polar amino acid transport system substrate-binding protein
MNIKPRQAAVFLYHLTMKITLSLLLFFFSQISFSQPMNQIDPKMIQSFAPTGTLRVGINLGNPVLAGLDTVTQKPKGVSIDIANEIGKRSGIPIELIPFQSAGSTVDAIKTGNIDLIFVAIDPVRGADVNYTPPYIQIEGAYMVKADSKLKVNEEVDRSGVEIVVGKGSAYDLFLTREIKNAALLRAASSQAVIDDFMAGKGNVAAGVKQQLESDAKRYNGLRMLPGRFMVINQAIGIPKARPEFEKTTVYLSGIITDLKSSGFVANSMKRHGIEGAKVAE